MISPMSGSVPPPTVWIEEQHRDQLIITEHPVDQGASVSDHAFKRPAEVTLRLGWNGESIQDIQATYALLLQLQSSRTLFDLYTGKRSYINMLIADLAVQTDERTEYVLMATARCREVLLVNTMTVTAGAGTNLGTGTLQPGTSANTSVAPFTVDSNLTPGT
jgi:hypothetical protein